MATLAAVMRRQADGAGAISLTPGKNKLFRFIGFTRTALHCYQVSFNDCVSDRSLIITFIASTVCFYQ